MYSVNVYLDIHNYSYTVCLYFLFLQGISNVAYVSLGLGLSNQVSEAFIEAKVRRIIVK